MKIPSHVSIDFIEAKFQLKRARQRYAAFIKHARAERDTFIDSLAEANAKYENKPKLKVLRRIKHEEEQHQYNAKLKATYKKSKFQRLDRVVITHNGHNIEITEPHRVSEERRRMNNEKYSSTNTTPMMDEPYVSSVGYLAEKHGGQLILNGQFGFSPNTHPVERELISRLKKPTNITNLPIIVTEEEYKTAWRLVKEKKIIINVAETFWYLQISDER